MSLLYIIGAGGFGREALAWANAIPASARNWKIAGFLDANPGALDHYACGAEILGDPESYEPQSGDCFICAIGNPTVRLKVTAGLEARGAEFISIIHPKALVGPRVVIGPGTIICPGAILSCDIRVGRHVIINLNSSIGHDAIIEDGCTLSCQVDVTGGAILERGVFAGSHAAILPGIRVGAGAVIGAGSVVVRNVDSGTTVIGVPARKLAE
jgi:sugar O-acyltransferase (sialic acid O-acetyltransferase NeuD family)